MKKRIAMFLSFLTLAILAGAQVPQKFHYQAVVRNANHEILAGQEVGFRLSILRDAPDGQAVYMESHHIKTNAVGLADMVIGDGEVEKGNMADVPWGDGIFFLMVEADPEGGTGYEHLGTSQLISVPYALYSANISSPTRKFTVQEEVDHPKDSALFEVRNKDGQTVFAVYPEGTRVYVLDEPTKGRKGGFAVGGYSKKNKGVTNEYMHISPDSIRMYVEEGSAKKKKGGFAVGGYSKKTKGPVEHYFELGPDSARFTLVSETEDRGGNALSVVTKKAGSSPDDPASASLFDLTWDNYFIGHRAGEGNSEGTGNAYLGLMAGRSNKTGSNNAFIGFQAGHHMEEGSENVIIGFSAAIDAIRGNSNVYIGSDAGGQALGDMNVFLGTGAGLTTKSGNRSVMIGAGAGQFADSSENNVFIGTMSGYKHQEGQENVFLGNQAGWSHQKGGNNVFIGGGSGQDHVDGSNNVFIGDKAGFGTASGKDNIYLGAGAGMNVSGDGKLIIDAFGRPEDEAFIWGDMVRNSLRVNKQLGIGMMATSYALEVQGDAYKSTPGDWQVESDARIKTEVREITDALETIQRLRPVSYRYTDQWMDSHPSIEDRVYYNYIAQEYQEVFPGSVHVGSGSLEGDPEPLLQMEDHASGVVAIKAIQELAEQNRAQQEVIGTLLRKVEAMEDELQKLR